MARTKEFNKEDILDKAIETFSFKGYNGASMEEIINHTGLSISSLYDTFGDKHQLYIAALDRYKQLETGSLAEMANNSTDALSTIKKIFMIAVNKNTADEFFTSCFMISSTVELAPHDATLKEMVNGNMREVEDVFYKLIKKGQSKGDIPKKNTARALARFLFNTTAGLRVAAKGGADKKVFDDIVKVAMSALSE